MTFRGTAPQSTRRATSTSNWSSAIICRVPDIEAAMASCGRNATGLFMAGNIPVIARGGKPISRRNIA